MNHRAKFDAASFILGEEIRRPIRTNKQTHTHNYKKTVTDISTPCLSACVDKNRLKWSKNANFTYPNCIWRPLWG